MMPLLLAAAPQVRTSRTYRFQSPHLVAALLSLRLFASAAPGYCEPPPFDGADPGTVKAPPAPAAVPTPPPPATQAPTASPNALPAPPAAPAPATAAAPGTAGPAVPAQGKQQAPRAILVWSGPPGEGLPPPIRQALLDQVLIPSGGALSAAAETVNAAKKALAEMRCGEALPHLIKATDRVLEEDLLPDARPVLSELYGLTLLCADRTNDTDRAQQASSALRAMQAQVGTDVALVLARYLPPQRFGPPRAPVHIESDPPGAVVLRDLLPVGVTPIDVAGGQPERDFVDIEMPGFRKVHRALGSNQEIILSLRPEDRVPVLLDRAALFPPGSDGQEAVLRQLAASAGAQVLVSRLILTLGPKERSGAPVAGESLIARLFDLDRKAFTGPPSDVPAGPAANQAKTLLAMCSTAAAQKSGALLPGAVPGTAQAAPPAKKKSWWPFSNTKWYTWVVAGGVAALIAGLLIAEKVSPQTVTITATH